MDFSNYLNVAGYIIIISFPFCFCHQPEIPSKKEVLKYLIMHYFQTNQSILENSFKTFPRKRDFYRSIERKPNSFDAFFPIIKFVADALNATLITEKYASETKIYTTLQVYPNVRLFGAQYTLENLTKYFSGETNKFQTDYTVTQLFPLDNNFAYCDTPRNRLSAWDVEFLVSAFSWDLWAFVLLSMVIVVVAELTINFRKQGWKNIKVLDLICMVVFSFTEGIEVPKSMHKSFILTFWLMVAYILADLYSGVLTSVMISPSEEKSIDFISELASDNYSLVFPSKGAFTKLKVSTDYYKTKEGNKASSLQNDLRAIIMMMKKVNFIDVNEQGLLQSANANDMAVHQLAFKARTCIVDNWISAINMIDSVRKLLDKKKGRHLHCYIGKRLLPSGTRYSFYVSLVKDYNGILLTKAARATMEAGIFLYWRDESLGLGYSDRVQERSRLINPTKLKYKFEENDLAALKIEGNLSTAFFLWAVCMGICGICFIVEMIVVNRRLCFCGLKGN